MNFAIGIYHSQMKRQLSILTLLLLIGVSAMGQNRTISGTGDWNDTGIWVGGNIADELAENVIMNNGTSVTLTSPLNYTVGNYTANNNNTLTINSGAELNIGSSGNPRNFNSGNNTVVNVFGTLIIWGDLVVNNNLVLVVTGTLIIKGNIDMKNGGALNVSGNMTVDGDFIGGNNTAVDVDGSITVGGNVDVGNGSTLTGDGTFTGGGCSGPTAFCTSGTFVGPPLYSRKSGTWRDATGGVGGTGTWSRISHTGAACGCVPQNNERAIIGNGHTVTLPLSQTTVGAAVAATRAPSGVIVENTGTLQFSVNNITLGIQGNLARVESGGTINASVGVTGSRIQFQSSNTSLINNGALSVADLFFLDANTDNNTVTNNGTLTAAITVNNADANGNVFTNNTGATFNTSTITLNNGDFTLNNSGIINQSGGFASIDAGSSFNNLNGATWNFSGTGPYTNVRLFANNGINNFNYTAAGAQQIITPVAVAGNGYSNISFQNSGVKTALANFNVFGNWTRSGTATFAPATFAVTFSGTIAQTISAVGGETFNNLIINNTFATAPQITLNNPVTVTGTLTMTSGRIDLNGNNFTIGASAASPGTLVHAGASTNGWMYGGSLRRFVPTTAIAIGAVAGFFPIGSSSNFRPFFIGKNNPANSGGALTLTFTEATTTSNVSIGDPGPPTITRRHDSFWSLSTSGITAGTWALRAGGTNFGTIQELPDLRMSTTTSVVGTHAAATGSIADPRVNRTGLTVAELANNFHVASTDAINSPLPITLFYLKADQEGTFIRITWGTSSEEDFSHFILEHSVNGISFTALAEISGAGYNTESINEYSYTHKLPILGANYYRLKAVDLDGTFEYFGPVSKRFTGDETLWIYPNPSAGDKVEYLINFTPNEGDRVMVYNQLGFVVADEPALKNSGIIYFSESLKPGAYILRYSTAQEVHFARFIVVK